MCPVRLGFALVTTGLRMSALCGLFQLMKICWNLDQRNVVQRSCTASWSNGCWGRQCLISIRLHLTVVSQWHLQLPLVPPLSPPPKPHHRSQAGLLGSGDCLSWPPSTRRLQHSGTDERGCTGRMWSLRCGEFGLYYLDVNTRVASPQMWLPFVPR